MWSAFKGPTVAYQVAASKQARVYVRDFPKEIFALKSSEPPSSGTGRVCFGCPAPRCAHVSGWPQPEDGCRRGGHLCQGQVAAKRTFSRQQIITRSRAPLHS